MFEQQDRHKAIKKILVTALAGFENLKVKSARSTWIFTVYQYILTMW